MNDVTELVKDATTTTWTLAVGQERLGQVGWAELVLRANVEDVTPAVDEVPSPVAPVPMHAGGTSPYFRAAELSHDDPVRALDARGHRRGPGQLEGAERDPASRPHENRSRHAQVRERVVHPERLVRGRLTAEVVQR